MRAEKGINSMMIITPRNKTKIVIFVAILQLE